jgi:hypothetical protein
VIHLYAFVEGLRALPCVNGAGGERLEVCSPAGLTAVVGNVHAALPTTAETAIAHARVVESIGERAQAVLPARLDRPFPDVEALIDALRGRTAALRSQLVKVSGCVEVGVQVAQARTPSIAADGGSGSYLRRLAAENAARAAVAEELQRALDVCAVDCRVDSRSDGTFRAAYLVRREDVDRLGRRVDDFAARRPELAVVCTGPWAPYSFAEAA